MGWHPAPGTTLWRTVGSGGGCDEHSLGVRDSKEDDRRHRKTCANGYSGRGIRCHPAVWPVRPTLVESLPGSGGPSTSLVLAVDHGVEARPAGGATMSASGALETQSGFIPTGRFPWWLVL